MFVVMRMRTYASSIDLSRFDANDWCVLSVSAAAYMAADLMLAMAWWKLLAQFGVRTSRKWAVKIYGISQIGKYVPGNFFHLAGRQSIGMASGFPAWPLAKSSAWELGLISIAAAALGLLATPLVLPRSPYWVGVAFSMVALVILAAVLMRTMGQLAVTALAWHIGFLMVSGSLFVGLMLFVVEAGIHSEWSYQALFGAYTIAWLAGLVTPGAPAGLGVRELVLLVLLNGAVGGADLLLAVLLGRVVTVIGDFAYYLLAVFVRIGNIDAGAVL